MCISTVTRHVSIIPYPLVCALLCGGASVSTLQDVLVFASPRLLHLSTAIGASLASFSATAQAVMGLTINSTAQLAQVLTMPEPAVAGLAHR